MERKIGIDLGGTSISFIDLYSPQKIIDERRIDTPCSAGGITEAIVNVLKDMLPLVDEKPAGIGIAVAGQVNPIAKSVIFSPNLPFKEEFPLGGIIHENLNLPVVLENDANSAAIGEKVFGAAKDIDDFIVLTLGTGIGSGIFVNGKLLRGHTHAGGEAGHMVIDPTGPKCGCGRNGCLEVFASGTAISRRAANETGVMLSAKEVCESAKDNERLQELLKDAGEKLAEGLASLVSIFNPEAIFFAGSLANAPKYYFEPAFKVARSKAFGTTGTNLRLEISELKEKIGMLGAAGLV